MKKFAIPAAVAIVLILLLPSIVIATNGQQEPFTPKLTGPTQVKRFIEYTYTAVTTDPQGDNIYYKFSFYLDDNNNYETGWLGPVSSGSEVSATYTFLQVAGYQVGAKAKDTSEHESNWATLEVNVEKLFDSSLSSPIPEQSETAVSSITVTVSLSGVIVQQITVPLYYNVMNQQQQNPQ